MRTDGEDGEPAEFEVAYVFGVYPLQQYLLPLSRGRLQALIEEQLEKLDRSGAATPVAPFTAP